MLRPMTDEEIEGIAEFGAVVSRHCRNAWTGEQIRVTVECEKLGHPWHKAGRQVLDFLRLVAWERIADLNQIRLGIPGQHSWKKVDWERAIRFRIEHGREARPVSCWPLSRKSLAQLGAVSRRFKSLGSGQEDIDAIIASAARVLTPTGSPPTSGRWMVRCG